MRILNHLYLLVWVPMLLTGCAVYEQYPHPYISHDKLPFTEGAIKAPAANLDSDPVIGVCDFESEVVSPVGGYFVENHLQQPIALDADVNSFADSVSVELTSIGARTARAGGVVGSPNPHASGDPPSAVAANSNPRVLLMGTLVDFEYSRYGLKKSPYDFLFLTVRFALHDPSDGKTLWQGDVSVYRKNVPAPDVNQASMAADAIREAAHYLAGNDSFRSTLHSFQKAG